MSACEVGELGEVDGLVGLASGAEGVQGGVDLGKEARVERTAVAPEKAVNQNKLAVDDEKARTAAVAASNAGFCSCVVIKFSGGSKQNKGRAADLPQSIDLGEISKTPGPLRGPKSIPSVVTG